MSGFRSYCNEPQPPDEGSFILTGQESHHLTRVLRARIGDEVTLFNGTGDAWRCEICNLGRNTELDILEKIQVLRPRVKLNLAQVITKGKSMDLIFRQATELGVSSIFPLKSERCEVRLTPKEYLSKSERWNAISIEACKQSGNLLMPSIKPISSLNEFLTNKDNGTFKLIASLLPNAKLLKNQLENIGTIDESSEICLLIGPEGDFSDDEYVDISDAGFSPVRLSQNVLKAGTAALYGLSAIDAIFA